MTKFTDLGLDPNVLKAIEEAGYEEPTPIQAKAIPEALKGRDVLGIAQTGTGKTASFVLPMITLLQKGRAKARMPRSLVLAPTRELAAQVAENFDIYAKYTNLTKALLIGGVSFKDQERLIDRGVDVLIATPGRLLDHFERGKLLLTGVQILVVDEADRMLDMGFIPDIERIFKLTPFTKQTLFFSATMPPEISRLVDTFLFSPARVEVARQATTGENIKQELIEFTPSRKDKAAAEKRELLRRLIRREGDKLKNAIIFCNRKVDVDILYRSMRKHGYNVGAIHGDLDQSERMRVLNGFRAGEIQFLIASDVAARGLDIPAVSHVFNFDVPVHAEDYVHRIGRTGRAGREGTAITIALPHEAKAVANIEKLIKQPIPRGESPWTPRGARPAPATERVEEPAAEAASEGGSGKRKRRRRRKRKSGEQPAAEAQAAAPAETQPAEAASGGTGEGGEKPRKKRRRRRRRKVENVLTEGAGAQGASAAAGDKPEGGAAPALGGQPLPAFLARPLRDG